MKPTTTPPTERPPGRDLLDAYRREFAATGTVLPLRTVPVVSGGLLAELPPPPEGRTGWPWTEETMTADGHGRHGGRPSTIRTGPGDGHGRHGGPDEALAKSGGRPSTGMWPRISVVTPSFGQAAYLEETIRSVLLQNYPNLEYIVMDGGSTDGSAEIIEKYRPWLSFGRSSKDRGQSHAINLGFSLTSGDVTGWINSDDFYLPGAFFAVGAAFRDRPRTEFLHGDSLSLIEMTGKYYYSEGDFALDRYLQFGGLIFSHTAFWRSEFTLPLWEAMQCNVDGELWFRLLKGRRRYHLPLPLALNRSQPDAKTVHPRWRKAWESDERLIWPVHGYPPAPRAPIRYEYRYMQRYYKRWMARRWRARRQAFLVPSGKPIQAP